ncbi:MAG: hypothetical protein WD069_10660 [Planctomycetales bacterium]
MATSATDPSAVSAAPPRRRRWLRGTVWFAAVWATAEVVAALALWGIEGQLSFAELHRAQFAAAHPLEVSTGSTEFLGGNHRVVKGTLERPADFMAGDHILHPYTGYVFDAASRLRAEPVNEYGFVGRESPVRKKSPDTFIVGVLGGSIAFEVAQQGGAALAAELKKSSEFAGREIVVVPLAMAGYKQPQPLLFVNYLLAQGAEFDAIVLLDGFNDVVHASYQQQFGYQSPAFPLGWRARVDALRNESTGGASPAARARQEWAMIFRNLPAPLAYSPLVNLVWRLRDLAFAAPEGARSGGDELLLTGPRGEFEIDDEDSLFRELVDLWRRGSLQLARTCRANGIEYHHFLQPNQYVEGSKPMNAAERSWAFAEDHPFRHAVRKGFPMLLRASQELEAEGVPFHDLTGLFAEIEGPIYVDSCCYMNARGYEMLGAAIGRTLAGAANRDGP